MSNKTYLKAVAEGYNPRPFFFREDFDTASRLVVWSPDAQQMARLMHRILESFPFDVEVLFKVASSSQRTKETWIRYGGLATLRRLNAVMDEFSELLYLTGESQLCIRRTDSGEYVALDEHCILFVYSTNVQFEALCREQGFEERRERLISEEGHWHLSRQDTREYQLDFIRRLGLHRLG